MVTKLSTPCEQEDLEGGGSHLQMGEQHLEEFSDESDARSSSSSSLCSWHSPAPISINHSTISPYRDNDIMVTTDSVSDPCRKSCVSDCSLEADLDLESGNAEINKASPEKTEKNCRICHLSLDGAVHESAVGIVLGCSCKDDLAAAHRNCAETWFKIKGNNTCEICGSTAHNVIGSGETEFMEQWNETNNNNNNNQNNNNNNNSMASGSTQSANERRRFWQGHRFLNFLLACMVFAFVISWLFHFNVPG